MWRVELDRHIVRGHRLVLVAQFSRLRTHTKLVKERKYYDEMKLARQAGAKTIYRALRFVPHASTRGPRAALTHVGCDSASHRYCIRTKLEAKRRAALEEIARPMLRWFARWRSQRRHKAADTVIAILQAIDRKNKIRFFITKYHSMGAYDAAWRC